ncbi:MAG: double-strand break repair protein AddB [Proteobacteria bacterium]|nr:double-strand break repair protein AddB [Pseudomonadota bacterium]
MFKNSTDPHLFGIPPGVDFPKELVAGLRKKMVGKSPEKMAEIDLYVNSTRMKQRVKNLLTESGALILPRILTLSELNSDIRFSHIKASLDPLGLRLELSQLIAKLIELEPDMGSTSATFDLAHSLANLIEEMHDEGIKTQSILDLNLEAHSEYWNRNKRFFKLIDQNYNLQSLISAEQRQRLIIEDLEVKWAKEPPQNPIIIAGSTGSRGTTKKFIKLVARLPQGAIILPGVDFEMSEKTWKALKSSNKLQTPVEDHPQYRLKTLLKELQLGLSQVEKWTNKPPHSHTRNQLISLALRPAPVTDDWLEEGPKLLNLSAATKNITILEAQSERSEALSIAIRIRKAIEDGISCSVITPNRTLARKISAALKHWDIEADDGAGLALSLSVSGRLFRKTAKLMSEKINAEGLITLLKHPLICFQDRGSHLTFTRKFELSLLRGKPKFPSKSIILEWADTLKEYEGSLEWVHWLFECLNKLDKVKPQDLSKHIKLHTEVTWGLVSGPKASNIDDLFLKNDTIKMLEVINNLKEASVFGGVMDPHKYADLIYHILSLNAVYNPITPRSDVKIWGTQEARVTDAGLVILAGLNENMWPSMPSPDPWLSRQMRHQAGLPLPERMIGLSAHDFQQAVASEEVWLTRSIRDSETETVPSRWLNRLSNLLIGLTHLEGSILDEMKSRGRYWLRLSDAFETPKALQEPAKRPSPQPPVHTRPKKLSVTRIEKLIRDPYSIYARYVLNLKQLQPLVGSSDAALRGQAIHAVLEKFINSTRDLWPDNPQKLLKITSDEMLESFSPSRTAKLIWMNRIEKISTDFILAETIRRATSKPFRLEERGEIKLGDLNFSLTGIFDRIDECVSGDLIIYDYKTGEIPSENKQKYFDKQIQLLALILKQSGVTGLKNKSIREAFYIGLGSKPKNLKILLEENTLVEVWSNLSTLISSYNNRSRGYSARRAVFETRWEGDYDHLARLGEWDHTDDINPEIVGP